MIFKQIPIGPMQNFSYLIGCKVTGEAAIVDPGWEPEKLVEEAQNEKLKITKIIITHFHYDHTQQANQLQELTGAEVLIPEQDAPQLSEMIQNPEAKITIYKDNDIINLGKQQIKTIHTPGHSPGSSCLLIKNKLITGDTLFVEGIGRMDLPGGSPEQLFNSLQKLKQLDENIEVYPGHDYGSTPSSTIGNEKQNNPYLRMSREEFIH